MVGSAVGRKVAFWGWSMATVGAVVSTTNPTVISASLPAWSRATARRRCVPSGSAVVNSPRDSDASMVRRGVRSVSGTAGSVERRKTRIDAELTPAAGPIPEAGIGSAVRSQISGVGSLVKLPSRGLAISIVGAVRSMTNTTSTTVGFAARSAVTTRSVCGPSLSALDNVPAARVGPMEKSAVTSISSRKIRVAVGSTPVSESARSI